MILPLHCKLGKNEGKTVAALALLDDMVCSSYLRTFATMIITVNNSEVHLDTTQFPRRLLHSLYFAHLVTYLLQNPGGATFSQCDLLCKVVKTHFCSHHHFVYGSVNEETHSVVAAKIKACYAINY